MFFGINRDNLHNQIYYFLMISIPIIISPLIGLISNNSNWYQQIFHIGILLAIPLLKQYNGEPGGSKNSKWLFYIFYPLHLLVLGLLKYKF